MLLLVTSLSLWRVTARGYLQKEEYFLQRYIKQTVVVKQNRTNTPIHPVLSEITITDATDGSVQLLP